jgi:hypothetical protein
MAYNGELLDICRAQMFNWNQVYVVVVTGDAFNPCGHAILNVGGIQGFYFQVAPPWISRPRYMTEAGYQRYLKENDKTELKRQYVQLPKPKQAQAELDRLLSETWTWLVLPNNCASFVERIIAAGGSSLSVWWNCPSREVWQ